MPDPLTSFRRVGAPIRTAPRPLLRDAVCRVCGRPAAEGVSCPYCGERVPLARGTVLGIALFALAFALAFVRSAELHSVLNGGWPGVALSFACGAALSRNRAATPWFVIAAGAFAVLAARFAFVSAFAHAAAPAIALSILAALPAQPPVPFAAKRAAAAWTFLPALVCASAVALCAHGAFADACAVPYLPVALCLGAVVSRMDSRRATVALVAAAFFFSAAVPSSVAFCIGAAAALARGEG